MSTTVLNVGDHMPKFALNDQNGSLRSSEEFRGHKYLAIYFYPKDETPGCSSEACGFRDDYHEFIGHDCEVIGISSDSVKSHQHFIDKYKLPFILLSDPQRQVARLFGVEKNWFGLVPGRVTFIVDKSGIIAGRFEHQLHAKRHVKEALTKLNEIDEG